MDVTRAYALLKDVCNALDDSGDHAAAAYVGHGMALLETKYGFDPDAIACSAHHPMPPPASRDGGNTWA